MVSTDCSCNGKPRYVENTYFWALDSAYYLTIKDTERLLMKYLYYFLLSLNLEQLNEGSIIPTLRRTTLNKIILGYEQYLGVASNIQTEATEFHQQSRAL